MKLSVRRVIGKGGVEQIVLCDENGVMLPCQAESRLECCADSFPKLTITFHIEGRHVVSELGAMAARAPRATDTSES